MLIRESAPLGDFTDGQAGIFQHDSGRFQPSAFHIFQGSDAEGGAEQSDDLGVGEIDQTGQVVNADFS